MCLHNILGKPDKTEGIGYKVYDWQDKKLTTECCNLKGNKCFIVGWDVVELGKTYHAIKTEVFDLMGEKYDTGFHIWETLSGAEEWAGHWQKIVKVSYKSARLTGMQREQKCIIADEITLLEIIK